MKPSANRSASGKEEMGTIHPKAARGMVLLNMPMTKRNKERTLDPATS
jgi:hypothetical protein